MKNLLRCIVGATFGLAIVLSASVSAQMPCSGAELQCHNAGGGTSGWSGAWQSFDSNGLSGKAVDSVVLRLRAGGSNTAEGLTITIYGDSDGTNSACAPDMITALATSAAVTVPNDNAYRNLAFNFADDVLLDPAETYYFRLEDPTPNGGDQIIVFDNADPAPIPGGTGGNCRTLHHQVNARDVDLSTIDSDNDGVTDDLDQCANTPEGAEVDADGCADSQKDTDNDGVTDDLDQCENTPEGAEVDADGCADSQKDTDNDGVTDDLDQCENTPEGAEVDADGCADSQKDTDNDGVTDDLDQCENTPEGAEVDADGCADSQKDTDNDGVTDDLDQCENTPEGAEVDEVGCSDSQKAGVPAVTVPAWQLPFALLSGLMILLLGGFRLSNRAS